MNSDAQRVACAVVVSSEFLFKPIKQILTGIDLIIFNTFQSSSLFLQNRSSQAVMGVTDVHFTVSMLVYVV